MRRLYGDADWKRADDRMADIMRLNLAGELIAGVIAATSEAALHLALSVASHRMGFDYFAVSCDRRPARSGTHHLLLHSYPAIWARTYIRLDFAARDPVRRHCEKSPNGFGWSEVKDRDAFSPGQAENVGLAGVSRMTTAELALACHKAGAERAGTSGSQGKAQAPVPGHLLMLALAFRNRHHAIASQAPMIVPIGWVSAQKFLRESGEIVGRRHDAARCGRDLHHRSFRQVNGIMRG